jgi:hypothetical protein
MSALANVLYTGAANLAAACIVAGLWLGWRRPS